MYCKRQQLQNQEENYDLDLLEQDLIQIQQEKKLHIDNIEDNISIFSQSIQSEDQSLEEYEQNFNLVQNQQKLEVNAQLSELFTNQVLQNQRIEQQLWQIQTNQEYGRSKGLSKEHYKLLKTNVIGKTKQQCSICYQDYQKGERIKKLPCGHIFHVECIKPWLAKRVNCPNCRFDLKNHFENNCSQQINKFSSSSDLDTKQKKQIDQKNQLSNIDQNLSSSENLNQNQEPLTIIQISVN